MINDEKTDVPSLMIDVNLTIILTDEEQKVSENEFIENVRVLTTNDGRILLNNVITQLKFLGYNFNNSSIWFYSNSFKDNVFCGNDPLVSCIQIDKIDLAKNALKLMIEVSKENLLRQKKLRKQSKKKVKHRQLEEIIHSVFSWKKLVHVPHHIFTLCVNFMMNGPKELAQNDLGGKKVWFH